MKKQEVMLYLLGREKVARRYLDTRQGNLSQTNPTGLYNTIVKARGVVEGYNHIKDELSLISDDAEFEILKKGEFEKYFDVANNLNYKDVKKMSKKWKELFSNIEHMGEIFNETSYKMGEISIYGTPKVYIIFLESLY